MTASKRIMRRFTGRAVSHGLATGNAFIYRDIFYRSHELYSITSYEIEDEYARIENAIEEVVDDLRLASKRVENKIDENMADIFRAHEAMLRDSVLLNDIRKEIDTELVNAERIVSRVFRRWERRFRRMDTDLANGQGDDIADLGRRLLRRLLGIHAHTLNAIPSGTIVVAKRLLPSDTVFLSRQSTAGVVVEFCGASSHTALLTREMGIPAVSHIDNVLNEIVSGDTLLIDGTDGTVTVNPDTETKTRFKKLIKKQRTSIVSAHKRSHEPARTKDGVTIDILANVSCGEDVELAVKNGADGVGLYRIEGIYLSRQVPPSEQDILCELQQALKPMRGKSVAIRLLDAGGDKDLPFVNLSPEPNPFLGRRGVRLLFDEPGLLAPQLAALLRLSQHNNIHILVPMLTFAQEMVQMRQILKEVANDMGVENLPPLGAMIETPAAALCVGEIAKHVDFLSIGTNDLTQYTMAAGRENPLVDDYFIDDHPAVRRLLQMVIDDAGDVPVSICGELAGRREGIRIAIKCGIRCLSVAPSLIPSVKEIIRELHT